MVIIQRKLNWIDSILPDILDKMNSKKGESEVPFCVSCKKKTLLYADHSNHDAVFLNLSKEPLLNIALAAQ